MGEEFLGARNLLKFCPECGKELVPHPNAPSRQSCFGHGDFVVHGINDNPIIQWKTFSADKLMEASP